MSFNKSSFTKETLSIFTKTFPLALSMGICAGTGAFSGIVFSFIAALFAAKTEEKKMMPVYISLLIATYTFKSFGSCALSVAVVFSGILLIISAFAYDKIKVFFQSPAVACAMLAGALCITILFTTDYFGIGATGISPREMIASYLSLGFHPNWRGVLYGTIVMVIMITFPRKFKKLSVTVNPAFIALVVTLLLNLFLNPSYMISAIKETGDLAFNDYKSAVLLPIIIQPSSMVHGLISGIALYIPCFFSLAMNESSKSDFLKIGITNAALGFTTCSAVNSTLKKNNLAQGLTAAVLTAVLAFVFKDYIARIPVHSCAVVLIVGAWQSVKWSELKKVFTTPSGILCLLIIMGGYILLNAVYGTIIAFLCSVAYVILNKKLEKA